MCVNVYHASQMTLKFGCFYWNKKCKKKFKILVLENYVLIVSQHNEIPTVLFEFKKK